MTLAEEGLSPAQIRAGRAAGIPKVHALRHACYPRAQEAQDQGLYTRVVVEDLREVLARAHPRERTWPHRRRQYNRQ